MEITDSIFKLVSVKFLSYAIHIGLDCANGSQNMRKKRKAES